MSSFENQMIMAGLSLDVQNPRDSSFTTHFPSRHATQPVTEDEVSQAARMADASDSASASHDSDCTPARRESRELP